MSFEPNLGHLPSFIASRTETGDCRLFFALASDRNRPSGLAALHFQNSVRTRHSRTGIGRRPQMGGRKEKGWIAGAADDYWGELQQIECKVK